MKTLKQKSCFGPVGEIIDGSIAYISLNGGGPHKKHTHEHDHFSLLQKAKRKSY